MILPDYEPIFDILIDFNAPLNTRNALKIRNELPSGKQR